MKLDKVIDGITPRLIALLLLALLTIGTLVFRLWYEQVRIGEEHRDTISRQSIRRIRLPAVRGRLVSSDGSYLADNKPSYDVLLHVYEMRQPGRNSRRRTLEHVVEQITRLEVALGRPSDLHREWAGYGPDEANARLKIRNVLNWYGVVVRGDANGGYWGWSPFTNDASKLVIDLANNNFTCPETGIRGGPFEFAAGYHPDVPEKQLVPRLAEQMTILRHVRRTPALPYQAFTGLTEPQLGRALGLFPGIKGMELATRMRRSYPLGPIGAHALGFTGRRSSTSITEDEIRRYAEDVLGDDLEAVAGLANQPYGDLRSMVFFRPELVGRSGLEAALEDAMCGEPGGKFVRVDSLGFLHGEAAARRPPVHGSDVVLTLDSRAQRIAQEVLGDQRAAFVAIDVNSGAVTAMASAPSWDPNTINRTYGELLNDDDNHPLRNRALRPDFFPGSIVKPIVAAVAIDRGLIDPEKRYVCPGYYKLGGRRIRCSHSHEPVDAVDALKHSCNTYFIDYGLQLGVDVLGPAFAAAGFGSDLGFELTPPPTRRRFGQVPNRQNFYEDSAWLYGRTVEWTANNTADCSIGQGYFKCSPLQAAVMTAAIANGGRVWRPRLVRELRNSDGRVIKVTAPEVISSLPVSAASLRIVQRGMEEVVWGAHGTGSNARTEIFPLAGKTGTAEAGGDRKHTWFVGYGPIGAPTHAFAVLVEDGRSGGRSAAPLLKEFCDRYFAGIALGNHTP